MLDPLRRTATMYEAGAPPEVGAFHFAVIEVELSFVDPAAGFTTRPLPGPASMDTCFEATDPAPAESIATTLTVYFAPCLRSTKVKDRAVAARSTVTPPGLVSAAPRMVTR